MKIRVNLITTIFIGICVAIIGYGIILYEIGNRNAEAENNSINAIENTIVDASEENNMINTVNDSNIEIN